jgi:osmotically-inducible protein OsmY
MSKLNNMKTNEELQKDVQDAIKWEPLLNAAEIGVTVKDGIVTLTGNVDSYSKKSEAEDAAKNVAGVKAVVEKIEVKFSSNWSKKEDSEIAKEVLNAFNWNWQVPSDKVKVKVEDGWVTLEGELNWNYQKEAAVKVVNNVIGVKSVSNYITIKSETEQQVEKKDIESALRRNWSIDDKNITVKVSGHKVTLTGTVNSWYQKDEAARITWNAPGVWSVDNELIVEYQYELAD